MKLRGINLYGGEGTALRLDSGDRLGILHDFNETHILTGRQATVWDQPEGERDIMQRNIIVSESIGVCTLIIISMIVTDNICLQNINIRY